MSYQSIRSKDRISPSTTSSTNFMVVLQQKFEAKKQISLKEVQILMTQFTVRSGINDRIDFNSGGVKVATLTPGPYTAATLLIEVLAQLKVADANFATCAPAFTGLVTITSGAAFTLLATTGANASRSALPMLGFPIDSTTSVTSQTGSRVMVVNQYNDLYISVAQFGQPNKAGNGTSYTFRVPITVDSGGLLKWSENENYSQIIPIAPGITQSFLQLQCTLMYDTGEIVDLLGADWQLVYFAE